MYEWDEGGPSRWRKPVFLLVVIGLAAAGWFVVKPRLLDGGASSAQLSVDSSPGSAVSPETATTEPTSTTTVTPTTTSDTTSKSRSPTTLAAPTTTSAGATTSLAAATTAVVATTTLGAATTTVAATTTAAAATSAGATTTAAGASYASLPDGSPVPVVVIVDEGRTALSGAVPSQRAVDTLMAVIADVNDFPTAPVDDQLGIDPDVPVGVGVRILELTSAVFPEGSAELQPGHARQLDRVVDLMTIYPDVTATVVGHADQGATDEPAQLLSRQRAESIVTYLVSKGVDSSRLSARAVGETDLLSIGDDEASLALGGRSELIVSGLFVPTTPPPTSSVTTTTG